MHTHCVICSNPLPATTAACPSSACFGCINSVLGLLQEIELMAPDIDLEPATGGGDGLGISRPRHGSRPPVDLARLAALDYRTVPTEDDPIRSVLGSLTGINNAIRDHHGERHPVVPLLMRELAYLRRHLTWCAGRDDFAEVVADIRDIHRQVRLLARQERPQRVGRCPAVLDRTRRCRAPLEMWPGDTTITCPACRSTWSLAEYLELADTVAKVDRAAATRKQRLIDRAALARATGRSEHTIRKHLEPVCYSDTGAAMYDPTLAVRLLATIHTRTRTPGNTRAGR